MPSPEKERTTPSRSWSFQIDDGDSSSGEQDLTEAERNLRSAGQTPFHKFVLTGGPCGGKTTGLARVFSFLKERGEMHGYTYIHIYIK